MTLCEVRTFYLVDVMPYSGKVEKEASESVSAYYVRKLSECVNETNRNMTVHRWLILVPLTEYMLNKHRLTIIGTLRESKNEIPANFVGVKVLVLLCMLLMDLRHYYPTS